VCMCVCCLLVCANLHRIGLLALLSMCACLSVRVCVCMRVNENRAEAVSNSRIPIHTLQHAATNYLE